MLKRIFDLFGAGMVLLIVSLPMLIIALAVRMTLGAPVLFRQQRPGFKKEPFTIYKLRTLRNENDSLGRPLSDEQRMTRFGAFLRSTSLDELPELFNVLKGDMSLVGPRPLLMEYLPLYSTEQARRHDVKPGITGWAQVNGRNAISWQEKFELDVWYVENQTFCLDARILWMTLVKVLKREGISQKGQATAEKFKGDR